MRIDEFDYALPKELIAQHPENERASSRLLVLNRKEGTIEHRRFSDILEYLCEGDVLVLNDSKVFPARLKAVKETGGVVDILLTERRSGSRWSCLAKNVKKGVTATEVSIGPKRVKLTREESGGGWEIDFLCDGDGYDIIKEYGAMPLPGYIKRKEGREEDDFERYQTVYAEAVGSIAAPTAGFHFTEDLLRMLAQKGVRIVKVTLHIGIGTFLLLKTETVEEHSMHREYYTLPPEAKAAVVAAKAEGRRVVACGTSAVRTLETVWSGNGSASPAGYTDLFIYPGYTFKVVDALITNFHLPRSTPLVLASAFAGKDELRRCYGEAIDRNYRFYSYGDAMLAV